MKELMKSTICEVQVHCEPGLRTIMFSLLNHLCEERAKLGSLGILDAFANENFNEVLKRVYWRILRTTGIIG